MKRIFTLLFALTGIYANAQSPGNTLHFDGTDYVSCPLPSLFTGISTNSFTVETWVKPTGSSTMRVFSAQQSPTVFTSILLNASNSPYIYIILAQRFMVMRQAPHCLRVNGRTWPLPGMHLLVKP